MRHLALAAWLLLAPSARAQAPAPLGREAFDSEIEAWRVRLPHVDPPAPLTVEFEPRLNAIAAAVKAAKTPAALERPRKDFDAWRHEVVLKSYREARGQGLFTGTLDQFSEHQRQLLEAYAAQRRQALVPILAKAETASSGSRLFYDNDGRSGTDLELSGGFSPSRRAAVNAEAQGVHLRSGEAPPPVTSAALSFQSVIDYVDSTRGGRIAHAVASRAVGFTHWCFASVKEAFIRAKDKLWSRVSDPTGSGAIGIPPALAADYARALNKNPQLMAKLGYRRVDPRTLPGGDPSVVPEGTVFDFAPGCAGYSAGAGHIEIVAARSRLPEIPVRARPSLAAGEVLACSDGCHGRSLNYFRTYGRTCMSMYVPVVDAPSTTLSL